MDHIDFQMLGDMPPSINQHHQQQQQQQQQQQPPRILGAGVGAYPVHDGLLPPTQHLPPEFAAQMFPDPQALFDELQEAKRRRIARACDMCRKKKIKCDGRLPACTQCINYKSQCVFTHVEKKRQPPKGAKYIEGLENRLSRMEHLLRLSGLLGDDEETDLGSLERKLAEKKEQYEAESKDASSTPASQNRAFETEGSFSSPNDTAAATSPTTVKENPKTDKGERRTSFAPSTYREEEEEKVEELSEMMCSLVTNQSGETRYIGSSSGFTIFSPKGIQWVSSKTGDNSFQKMISEVSEDDHKWTNWKPEVFGDVFKRPIFRQLPPKDEALSLLKDYFENFNCMCPLFHQPTFMHLVERQYSSDPYQGSGWWASLNCALAISHRLRLMSNLVSPDEEEKCWGYIKNALGVFTELTMRNTDLLSVQALVGIALFMQGTPNPQPSFLLVAAAIRLSHSIGLHKKGTGFNLNPIEIEQRKRVFWLAYMLDKDLCLRSGRPPAQDDDDMNVELPDADPEDNIGNIPLADGKGKMNLFRTMCEFSVIESKVYNRLYSTKATKQSTGELLNAIGELDQELEEWKDRIPIDFRPEHDIKASHTPLILHVVMLHFAYYNCLTTIHRMSVHHGFWTSRLSNYAIQGLNTRALNHRIFYSATHCTAAARASIDLLKYIPQGDFNCVWMILYFPVSALMTLFANILNNPLDQKAKSDIRLMNIVVTFLSMLGQEAEQGGVHRMLGVCAEFERIATVVIEKAERESRRKRKSHDALSADNASSSSSKPSSSSSSKLPYPRPPPKPSQPPIPVNPVQTTPVVPETYKFTSNNSSHDIPNTTTTHLSPLQTGPTASYSPMGSSMSGHSPLMDSSSWPPQDFNNNNSIHSSTSFDFGSDMPTFPCAADSPTNTLNMGYYHHHSPNNQQQSSQQQQQQPLLPHDLFSLPMTLDWNWAELSGGAYPTVENGNFGHLSGEDMTDEHLDHL